MLQARGSTLLQRMTPKRGFNSKIDSWLDRMLEKLPQGNIAYAIVALNTLSYGAYIFWPQYNMHGYLNNFTFSTYGLNRGYIHNLVTCHFSHQSALSYVLDSAIIFMLCQSVVMMNGPLYAAKTVLLSMFMGSMFLFFYHSSQGGNVRPFQGNDAIMRGIIFSIIF